MAMRELFEQAMYFIRPLKFCEGRGCYVKTPARKYGVPFCLSCQEENNGLNNTISR